MAFGGGRPDPTNPNAVIQSTPTEPLTIANADKPKAPAPSLNPTAPPPAPTAAAPEVQDASQKQDQQSRRGQAANMLALEDLDPQGLLGMSAPKTARNILLGA